MNVLCFISKLFCLRFDVSWSLWSVVHQKGFDPINLAFISIQNANCKINMIHLKREWGKKRLRRYVQLFTVALRWREAYWGNNALSLYLSRLHTHLLSLSLSLSLSHTHTHTHTRLSKEWYRSSVYNAHCKQRSRITCVQLCSLLRSFERESEIEKYKNVQRRKAQLKIQNIHIFSQSKICRIRTVTKMVEQMSFLQWDTRRQRL